MLLNLCFSVDEAHTQSKEYTVVLDVEDVCSWVIKFRAYGVIVNNLDLVNQECIDVDAKLTCIATSFWAIMGGDVQITDALAMSTVGSSGSVAAIEYLHGRLLATSGRSPCTSTSTSTPTASAAQMRRIPSNSRDKDLEKNRSREAPVIVPTLTQPLKSGWLLKKRELWNGWRCRYFVLYPGKLAYYTDQHDTQPKAVISLAGAEVYAPKRCTISGNSDHWYFM